MEKKNVLKRGKGITLVALIITVILMLIFAGVAVSVLTEDEGLFGKTKNSAELYELAAENENAIMSNFINIIDKYINPNLAGNDNNNNDNEDDIEVDEDLILINYDPRTSRIEDMQKPLKSTDKSSNSYDAQLTNIYYNNDKGIKFNGSSTYGTLDTANVNLTFPLTVTATVNWTSGSNDILFTDITSKIGIGTYNNKMLLSNYPNKSYYYSLPTGFLTNEVNYITVVYNASSADNKLYINGVEATKTSDNGHWNLSESGTYLGRRASGSYFNGILYNFKIYNKNLSADEVITLYELEKSDYENNTTANNQYAENIVLHYDCNEGENEEETLASVIKHETNELNDIKLTEVRHNAEKNGLNFNGTSSYGTIANSNFDISFPATVIMAVKRNSNDNMRLLFTNAASRIGIGFYYTDKMIVENTTSNVKRYVISNNYIEDKINYITVVYGENASDNKLYINGELLTEYVSDGGWNVSEAGTYIGRRNSGGYFNGTLYKLKVVEAEYTEEDVVKEYNKDKAYFSSIE